MAKAVIRIGQRYLGPPKHPKYCFQPELNVVDDRADAMEFHRPSAAHDLASDIKELYEEDLYDDHDDAEVWVD